MLAVYVLISDFVQLQIMLHGTEQSLEEGSESNLLPLDTPNVHALTELVMSCWNGDPQRRPSAEGEQEVLVLVRLTLIYINIKMLLP